MLPVRRAFVAARTATVRIQAAERGRVARRDFAELKRCHAAATRVQTRYRGHRARVDYLRTLRAVLVLQIAFRRWQVILRHHDICPVLACCRVAAVVRHAPFPKGLGVSKTHAPVQMFTNDETPSGSTWYASSSALPIPRKRSMISLVCGAGGASCGCTYSRTQEARGRDSGRRCGHRGQTCGRGSGSRGGTPPGARQLHRHQGTSKAIPRLPYRAALLQHGVISCQHCTLSWEGHYTARSSKSHMHLHRGPEMAGAAGPPIMSVSLKPSANLRPLALICACAKF